MFNRIESTHLAQWHNQETWAPTIDMITRRQQLAISLVDMLCNGFLNTLRAVEQMLLRKMWLVIVGSRVTVAECDNFCGTQLEFGLTWSNRPDCTVLPHSNANRFGFCQSRLLLSPFHRISRIRTRYKIGRCLRGLWGVYLNEDYNADNIFEWKGTFHDGKLGHVLWLFSRKTAEIGHSTES